MTALTLSEKRSCVCLLPANTILFHSSWGTPDTCCEQVTALACREIKYGSDNMRHSSDSKSMAITSSSRRTIRASGSSNSTSGKCKWIMNKKLWNSTKTCLRFDRPKAWTCKYQNCWVIILTSKSKIIPEVEQGLFDYIYELQNGECFWSSGNHIMLKLHRSVYRNLQIRLMSTVRTLVPFMFLIWYIRWM